MSFLMFFADLSMQLRLPFNRFGPVVQWGVFALGFAALIGLILWLYRYEARLVEPRIARLLLGLRLAVIGLLWAVMFLQPSIVRTTQETVPAKVMVALDRSGSMAILDPQRQDSEKLRIAKALHLADDLISESQYVEWITLAESGQLQFRQSNGSEDWNRKQRLDQTLQRVDKLSRAQIAQALLIPDGRDGLLADLAKRNQVEVVGFTQELGPLPTDPIALTAALKTVPASADFGTEVRLPLAKAQEASDSKVLGIVMLSDGRNNWGPSPVTKALELGQQGLPIFPVVFVPRNGPPDVAIIRAQGPSSVFQKTDANIEARVQVSNLPAGKVSVKLIDPTSKAEPLVETVEHDGQNHAYTLQFQARMDEAGTKELKLVAEYEPTEGTQHDEYPSNNTATLRVVVAPEKAKVLVIDGEARWEYHYLMTALQRDPTMDPQSIVFRQPRLGKGGAAATGDALPALTLPTDPDALLRYDCIILGDVTPEELPPAERIRLEKYVGERGGTLVMLAGKRSMPMQFLVDPRPGMDLDPIQRLLPLTNVQPVSAPNGFPVTLTGEGRLMPFLRLEPSGDLSAERWAKLPDHYWGIVGKAKEGAVPLASFRPRDAKEGVSERENALFVRQNFGFGRVLFVGLDSTWRWRYKTGDLYHHRFWGQVIRWAATDRPLIAGNEHIRFGTREPGYRQDQDIEFLVRLGEKVRKPTGESLIGTRIIRLPTKEGEKEQVVGLVPLTPNEYRPRELTGVTRDLPPGNYAMELVLPDLVDQLTSLSGSDPTKQRANFKIYPPDNAELVDLSPNVLLLEEIAERSGGKVYYVDQLTQLVERIAAQSVTRDKQDVQKLWQSWWTLILFVLLITMEWGLRKWAGLP